jgi:threonine/homoserine/homoserine lactone efflux protein
VLSPGPLVAFAIAAALLAITPGLDTALILRTAAVEGSYRARMAAAGICTGCAIWGSATALGLTALLTVSRVAYDTVRIAGAVYLVCLGTRMVRRKREFSANVGGESSAISGTGLRWYGRGLLTNLLNPKVGVFYVTLLPQFIPRGASVIQYSLLLTLIHVLEGIIWLFLLTMAVRPLRGWLRRPVVTRSLDCTTGAVLIGAGIMLALEKRK